MTTTRSPGCRGSWWSSSHEVLLSPVAASWILQIGTLALGSAGLYLLFSRTLGRSAAFVGAAVFAAFPFAHASGGADYQNALAGPLYALTWWLAIRCADIGGPRRQLFCVGVTAALTLHSSVVFASLIPVLVGHYALTYRDRYKTWPSILWTIVPLVIGGVAITLLLCVINALIGRDFFFFMRQFDLATSFVLDTSHQKSWWHPWSSGWFWTAQYLGPLAAVLLIAPVTLIAAWAQRPKYDQIAVYSSGYIAAALLWIFWQTQGQTSLDWFYFTYPLVFPFIGAIAADFAFWAPMERPLGIIPKLAICAILVGALACFDGVIHGLQFLPQRPLVQATVFGLIYGAIVALTFPRALRLWGGLAALSICFAFSMISPGQYSLATCSLARAAEDAVDGAHRYLRAERKSHGLDFAQVFMWADKNEFIAIPPCEGGSLVLANFELSLTSTGFSYLEPPWGEPRMEAISSQRLEEVASTRGLVVYVTN